MFPADASSSTQATTLILGTIDGAALQQQEDDGLAAQLRQLRPALLECAAHVVAGRFDDANRYFARISALASLGDGPLQRLAKIMAYALVRRLLCFTAGINSALMDSSYCDRQSIKAARSSFFKLVPVLKVAFVTINRAILDAMENEKFVHIVDLSGPAAHPWQWLKLMRAFHNRPEGAPYLRITVVHDDRAFLADMAAMLRKKAEALHMAFSFHPVLGRLETLDLSNLHHTLAIRSGEARAFSCALQMHRLLAVNDTAINSSVAQLQQAANLAQLQQLAPSCPPGASDIVKYVMEMIKMNLHPSPTTPLSPLAQTPQSPQWSFLSAVRALSPKVVAMMEQDASHNGQDFVARFEEALHYYAALFDALDSAVAACQMHEERAQVEQVLLGEEIKNILTREGAERHERHERLQQWAVRMENAGFSKVPLSYEAAMGADDVLRKSGLRGYEIREHGDCLLLCRSGRPLYAVSAWRPWLSLGSTSGSGNTQQQQMVVPRQITSTWAWPQQQAHNFTG